MPVVSSLLHLFAKPLLYTKLGMVSFRNHWPAYYYDQSHFIKEFKRFTGFTPQQYTAIVNEFGRAFSAKQ